MEKILESMLEELKYQTKLLETIIEGKPDQNMENNIEKGMDFVLQMPIFKNMGLDRDKLKSIMEGGQKK